MTFSWNIITDDERPTFRAVAEFLRDRLSETAALDWAASLGPEKRIERVAIDFTLHNTRLPEPWQTAWRLVEESWSEPLVDSRGDTSGYQVQARLDAGDRSGAAVNAIVDMVRPTLAVRPLSEWQLQHRKRPRRPKTFRDLVHANLTSGSLLDLRVIKLKKLEDLDFLNSLAHSLDAAVTRGVDIAVRVGWNGKRSLWQIGDLHRVYYVKDTTTDGSQDEPDAYHRGLAPSVKLLFEVVSQIAHLDPPTALVWLERWGSSKSLISTRLWAAMARKAELVPATDAAAFLSDCDDDQFWDVSVYPEIAELRSIRFNDFAREEQLAIGMRLKQGPPTRLWPKTRKATARERLFWSLREIKRITLASGDLPSQLSDWFAQRTAQFVELEAMKFDDGMPEGIRVRDYIPNPDAKFDDLEGLARLAALEKSLQDDQGGWMENPAERASDWLSRPNNTTLILNDLQEAPRGGNDFPRVWNRFGWAHSPALDENSAPQNIQQDAEHVLTLIPQLSHDTISTAIEGISNWLEKWRTQVAASPKGADVWFLVWPIAASATDSRPETPEPADLSVSASNLGDKESSDLDTLNTPAGKLVSVFLAYCSRITPDHSPLRDNEQTRRMRDTVIATTGRSGLIAKHRLIEHLPYFQLDDADWAKQNLLMPLLIDSAGSLALWRAISRRTQFTSVLEVIGGAMTERATDLRLGRSTRNSLVFSLVIEALHALLDRRAPAVPDRRVTQMLRTIEDEVRATAANAVQRFVVEVAANPGPRLPSYSTSELFKLAAKPFLQNIWPQERSLATPGVSKAFSDLPAAAGDAFAEVVDTIARFLVPFECWSMVDYGLYDRGDRRKPLEIIDDQEKAAALLRLLDLTISRADGAVVPLDLTDALDRIRSVSPQSTNDPIYRRLSASARRA